MDENSKGLWLSGRTLITRKPQPFEEDVPVTEYSVIDAQQGATDPAALAASISRAWTKFRLKSEGWFILRLQKNGRHKIEFPE